MAQGWNPLSPAETKPAARVWLYQLTRHEVPPMHYQELLDRAVDRRVLALAKNEQAPTLSVELVLVMFRDLVAEFSEECHLLHKELSRTESILRECEEGLLETGLRMFSDAFRQPTASIDGAIGWLRVKAQKDKQKIIDFWTERGLPDEADKWLS